MFSETHPTPMRTCSSSLLLNVRGVNYYNPFDKPVILSNAGLHSDVSDFTILFGIDVDDLTNVPVSTNWIRSLDYYKVIYLHISFHSHLLPLLLLFKVFTCKFLSLRSISFLELKMGKHPVSTASKTSR